MGLGLGRSVGWDQCLPRGRGWANARSVLTLASLLPFQVLLHVLFEHAVGYALLALKEVEEISLLLPQVGGHCGLAGGSAAPWGARAPACTARSHVAGRAHWEVRWARQLQSRGSLPAFVIRIALEALKSKLSRLHPLPMKRNRDLGPLICPFLVFGWS